MFIVLLKYVKPLNVVENFLQEHVDFLDKHYKRNSFIFSGRRDPRIGGVILVNSDDEVAVQEILMEDPFYKHQVAEYELIKFTPTKYADQFSPFINS
ncbi:YciI family protein [Bacillus cytotoxicus]|uniref:YCII-related n=1 Tax=Bacillus cytotoxicus (strain DSM 22905 / CIP 110041 / 391-98 / NVH 391-98) TaxID=315749 RepID=A7GR58_BACCN|nr:YciI family protein [Bacillus cytotoxicus]ABS22616.1 YCII-related [Bacillus cytotoxicus NVH 391-98]AWC45260.1 GTP cyclohydrolase [Bacillus cytotoxicus]MDH2865688.1 YciI family protein [Bacillus cytotoxicus]MDH2885704.1 YciI family protein [Bacillus cytotoxicus]MDH2889642.1 YciI family protein [Bacillus cytotoxicus]